VQWAGSLPQCGGTLFDNNFDVVFAKNVVKNIATSKPDVIWIFYGNIWLSNTD